MSLLTRHWELKLLALGFSVALWLFVMTSEKADLILSAPIEFDGVPPGLMVAGERPDSVDVQLHGLRGTLARLAPDQVKAHVSLAGVEPGEITLRLLPEQVIVPTGVTVVRVNPSRIRVVLAAIRSSSIERLQPERPS
ncbi:MAG TPA: CdaR family protein [Candidatus Methylomirabilis sp.]|nr:CdaR family protein [Candidatus Methylomirabilis sp.]